MPQDQGVSDKSDHATPVSPQALEGLGHAGSIVNAKEAARERFQRAREIAWRVIANPSSARMEPAGCLRRRGFLVRLIRAQDNLCGICCAPMTQGYNDPLSATIDHVVPLSKGGRDQLENMVAAHKACNTKKGNRWPTKWERDWLVETQESIKAYDHEIARPPSRA